MTETLTLPIGLDAITVQFRKALRSDRDHKLELGRLCHEYILAQLESGVPARTSRDMITAKFRELSKADPGTTMDASIFIGCWAVVDLLGRGNPMGMTLFQIREFRKVVHLNFKAEVWGVVCNRREARRLYKDAARSKWSVTDISAKIAATFPDLRYRNQSGRGRNPEVGVLHHRDLTNPQEDARNPMRRVLTADPRDAADLLAYLIRNHNQRDRLVAELKAQLNGVL